MAKRPVQRHARDEEDSDDQEDRPEPPPIQTKRRKYKRPSVILKNIKFLIKLAVVLAILVGGYIVYKTVTDKDDQPIVKSLTPKNLLKTAKSVQEGAKATVMETFDKVQNLTPADLKNWVNARLDETEAFFKKTDAKPIQTQEDLDKALDLIRDSLQKCIDEGAVIILE